MHVIGASLSEPHTNRVYEKIAVLLYVYMYVCVCVSAIRRPRVCALPISPFETPRAVSKQRIPDDRLHFADQQQNQCPMP